MTGVQTCALPIFTDELDIDDAEDTETGVRAGFASARGVIQAAHFVGGCENRPGTCYDQDEALFHTSDGVLLVWKRRDVDFSTFLESTCKVVVDRRKLLIEDLTDLVLTILRDRVDVSVRTLSMS